MKLSEHFDSSEFTCKCGCGEFWIVDKLIRLLEAMRAKCGCPLIINSGYRCPEHNAAVGGVPNSQHVLGTAADVQLPDGMTVDELANIAEECGADGIGKYDWGVHVDVRGYKARW